MVNEHRAAIHRVTRVYAADADARRELFQEIVYQLWRAFPAFRRDSSPMTWLYRIALNTAISSSRRRSRQPQQVPLTEGHHAAPTVAPVDDDARIERLSRAMSGLTDVERALMACYLEDMPYRRIADVLGISESNVGVRLHRVRAKLQRMVGTVE